MDKREYNSVVNLTTKMAPVDPFLKPCNTTNHATSEIFFVAFGFSDKK